MPLIRLDSGTVQKALGLDIELYQENSGNMDEIKPIVRWSFYLFVFSIPFEMPDLGLPFELAAFTGVLFLLAALAQTRVSFFRPPSALWWLFSYLIAYVFVSLLFGVERKSDAAKALFLLLQAMLICWCAYSLLRHEQLAIGALLTFVAACSLLALIQITGVAGTPVEVASTAERLSSFGQNPNKLGRTLGMGVIALIGLAFGMEKSLLRARFLAWPLLCMMMVAIVDTGSRGGLLAVAAGMLGFVFRSGSPWLRLQNTAIVLVTLGGFFIISYFSEGMRSRLEATFETGSLAKREIIFPEAWGMFVESPLFGWGPVNNMELLGTRVGEPDHPRRDTHNLFLELLTATGLVGAIPFLVGLSLCIHAAWTARGGPQGALPLALVSAALVANIGANLLYVKLFWLILAYSLAASCHAAVRGQDCGARQPSSLPKELEPLSCVS